MGKRVMGVLLLSACREVYTPSLYLSTVCRRKLSDQVQKWFSQSLLLWVFLEHLLLTFIFARLWGSLTSQTALNMAITWRPQRWSAGRWTTGLTRSSRPCATPHLFIRVWEDFVKKILFIGRLVTCMCMKGKVCCRSCMCNTWVFFPQTGKGQKSTDQGKAPPHCRGPAKSLNFSLLVPGFCSSGKTLWKSW